MAALQAYFEGRIDIEFTGARVVKGDYDFAQLKRYFDRVPGGLEGVVLVSLDIDETLNRVVLGVLDDEARERAALGVVALGNVPCAAVLIKLDEIIIIDR